MNLYDSGTKLSIEKIKQYESEVGFSFPQDYTDFLLQNNGGIPEEDVIFDFIDASNDKHNSTDIREFFVFYEGEDTSYDDIMKVNRIMHEEELLPEGLFVFCDDSGGNPVCMSLREDDYGCIYFCDHELEDADNGYLLMSYVAGSFGEFISKLRIM